MDREKEAVYLLDMGECESSSAISGEFSRGKWTSVEYSIAAGKGRMLFCGPDSQAPPVRLRLSLLRKWRFSSIFLKPQGWPISGLPGIFLTFRRFLRPLLGIRTCVDRITENLPPLISGIKTG